MRSAAAACPGGGLPWCAAAPVAALIFANAARMFAATPPIAFEANRGQARREVARRECRIAGHRRAPVPRTHVLADIAAEYVRPHGGTLRFGDLAAQFNGEIRDAPRGIETLPGD